MEYFSSRRTIRKYQNSRIDDNLLEQIIADATHCPTTGNMQLYSVVVTRDRSIINALSPAHFGQLQLKTCDAVLTICADFNRFVKW